jgi:hypothetical protein
MDGMRISCVSTDLASSEAYQHGRTLERLRQARAALALIATGKRMDTQRARTLARWGLMRSDGAPGDEGGKGRG